jgi:hypothetical protein
MEQIMGGYRYQVVHTVLEGTMFSGGEIWRTGFFQGFADADAGAPSDASVTAVMGAWQTFFTSSTSHISNSWQCTGVKQSLLSTTDGKLVDDNVVEKFYTTALNGNEGGGSLPPQVSLVAQLGTALPHGLGSKGRMYLPGIRTPVGTDGKIGNTEAGQVATNLKTFFDAVNAHADSVGHVINASKGSGLLFDFNKINVPVTKVRVGNVYDTQRRRRNALAEVYQTAVLA